MRLLRGAAELAQEPESCVVGSDMNEEPRG